MAKKILVVDDKKELRTLLKQYLAQEGFEIVTAPDGQEAIYVARQEKPDLIILDLMMPEMGGYEFMRIYGKEADTPILILTAKTEENDKVLGLELGADDYVTKPFSLRELMARIRAQLRRLDTAPAPGTEPMVATDPGPAPIHLDAVTVDLAGHRLVRDGVDRPVKPKAFELLAFLVRNPGQVFSRDQLLEKVWGYDYAGETRTVDVHVHWLRSAIEADPSQPQYLQTIRGVGYVLRLPEA